MALCSAAGRSGPVLPDSAQADLLCGCGGLQRENTRPHGEAGQRRQRSAVPTFGFAFLGFFRFSEKAIIIFIPFFVEIFFYV